jgi:hypothetical protein
MRFKAHHKHRAQDPASTAHAKSGLTALTAVITVITVVLVTAGSLFASSGASPDRIHHRHWWTLRPTQTLTATETATATATVTATKMTPAPTATVTEPGPAGPTATTTVTAPGPTATPTRPGPTATPPGGGPTGPTGPTGTPGSHAPYVGAAIQGNGSPTALEASAGRVLGLHRTYWNYNNVASSIKQATADAQAGRIPWLSYKLSVSWADAASGKADAATRALAAKLASVPGPVWVAINHEPEGDGNLSDWVAVQRRLLPLLAAAPNVRTSIILTAWDTFESGNRSYSLDSLWPGKMVSILGFDAYNPYGENKQPARRWVEMNHFYDRIAPAAKSLGVDWAIAETGYTDAAAAKDPDWLTRAYDDMANRPDLPGLGLCYFNSSANSVGSWPLTGVKDAKFDAILKRSHAVN